MLRPISRRPQKMAIGRKRPIFITSQGRNPQGLNEWAKTALDAQPPSSLPQLTGAVCDRQQDPDTSQRTSRSTINGPRQRQSQMQLSAIILLSMLIISSALVASVIGQQQLPTVIVRGFLNYRTTVDGTVLLFTPDAGQSQGSPASVAIQPSSSLSAIEPTSRTAATFFTDHPLTSPLQSSSSLEPTSVLLVSSSSTATGEGLTEPVAHPDSESATDEWRPVQATPPLRSQARGAQAPPLQADDLEPKFDSDSSSSSGSGAPSSSTTARPKRPPLGFSGQSLTRGSTGTFQSRFKSSNSSSINGIRRPGLSGQSAQTTVAPPSLSQQASGTDSSTSAANAFQSRLANANNRLRNRQKHRQPISLSPAVTAAAADNSSSLSASGNLMPDGALDVASSVEQATKQQAGHLQLQERPISALSQSAPAPVVGSDELLASDDPQSGQAEVAPNVASEEADLSLEPINHDQQAGLSALSRAGELRPSSLRSSGRTESDGESRPKLLSGGLQQGALSSGSMSFDALFQNDQPISSGGGESTRPSHEHPALLRPNGSALHKPKPKHHHQHHHQHTSNNNEKLSGWLGQHHNKFVPRPSSKPNEPASGHLSNQLASQLNQLAPTPTQVNSSPSSAASNQTAPTGPNLSNSTEVAPAAASVITATLDPNPDAIADQEIQQSNAPLNLQTITKTYSTLLSTSKTRLVPLQVKSSTAIYTITENYVLTKLMTAYQTMPAGEFLLPELATRLPFDIFDLAPPDAQTPINQAQPPAAAPAAPAISSAPIDTQEQPISLDSSPKSANNWLHDFTGNQESGMSQLLGDPFQLTGEQQLQQQNVLALLEQQASQANLAQLTGGNPDLEQLASQLNPTALLSDGSINIPDLNNPLVLAAAIQNPQLAALLLAAQQVRLKQRANLKPGQQLPAGMGQSALQLQLKALQLQQQQQQQPSISTSFSTVVKPSTYTARDTMYTTRLVSFRDGRTVRTRTVSEPGSVVEQVLTTTVTETIPITVTIKPTGVLALPAGATALPAANLQASPSQLASNQATINNALFATQLANLLAARRQQQQLQTSFQSPPLAGLSAGASLPTNSAATPQQLLGLQQLFGQQQKRQQQQQSGALNEQFQPNLQQLLQSFQSGAGAGSNSTPTPSADQQQANQLPGGQLKPEHLATSNQQTPALAQAPKSMVVSSPVGFGPITTTLTSLQVRTYTVHNAFKTIFRTITSTMLIPTVLPSG